MGEVVLGYEKTDALCVDALTKPLGPRKCRWLTEPMMQGRVVHSS